ncbi:hypothetical protein [Xanthomonas phage RTH11]|nr:hypothetical protein [Xanthomonas phage RTH11]
MATQPKVGQLFAYAATKQISKVQLPDFYGYALISDTELGFVPSLNASALYGYALVGSTGTNRVGGTYGYVLVSDKELRIADATGELLQQRQI